MFCLTNISKVVVGRVRSREFNTRRTSYTTRALLIEVVQAVGS